MLLLLEYQFNLAVRIAAINILTDKAVFRTVGSWCQMRAIESMLKEIRACFRGARVLGEDFL